MPHHGFSGILYMASKVCVFKLKYDGKVVEKVGEILQCFSFRLNMKYKPVIKVSGYDTVVDDTGNQCVDAYSGYKYVRPSYTETLFISPRHLRRKVMLYEDMGRCLVIDMIRTHIPLDENSILVPLHLVANDFVCVEGEDEDVFYGRVMSTNSNQKTTILKYFEIQEPGKFGRLKTKNEVVSWDSVQRIIPGHFINNENIFIEDQS